MNDLSPELLEFLKFFLSNTGRFDAGQQTTNVQNNPGLSGGEQQSTDAFQAFFKNFNLSSSEPQSEFSKFSFFS